MFPHESDPGAPAEPESATEHGEAIEELSISTEANQPSKTGHSVLNRFHWLNNILWALLGVLLGGLASLIISKHYYEQSAKDRRKLLLDNVILEINTNQTHPAYEAYQDTVLWRGAGRPFNYLMTDNIVELYKNLFLFDIDSGLVGRALRDRLLVGRFTLQYFNLRVQYRNDGILKDVKSVKQFNSGIFNYYYTSALPMMRDLENFITANRQVLER